MSRDFEELVAEAAAVPLVGWDFSWLDGRASEERPPWGYARLLADRLRSAQRALDLQTGGGEVLAEMPVLPPTMVATDGWPPNLVVGARRLGPIGGRMVGAPDDGPLPFRSGSFDLVTARHPVVTPWTEVARVLVPGGSFLSQQVGPHSVAELSEFFLGPQPGGSRRDPELARRAAVRAGLDVVDLRSARLRMEFSDVGAVVFFLRLVVWIVPGFSPEAHRERLAALHRRISTEGPFVAHSSRFLIEARLP